MGTRERLGLFAYGSLVSPASAALTLGRAPCEGWPEGEAVAAHLSGWRRRFSQARENATAEKTFALDSDGSVPARILGLNVERTGERTDRANGLLIGVTGNELRRLDVRELRYDRADVSGDVEPVGAAVRFDRIVTYVAKPSHLAVEPPPGAVVLRSYVRAVEEAFALLGAAELDAYRSTTGPPPVEVVDAHLVRDEIPPGNPRAW